MTNRDDKRTLKEIRDMVYPLKNHLKYLKKLKYDLNINTSDIPLGASLHPTKEGHGIIASKIYETYSKVVQDSL